ncbi:MAG TPA: methyltransferase domain-containing protein [Armatimonadota bacterium]|nr:methyltransferase domain-containing protein [Armatimonadota bacterium]
MLNSDEPSNDVSTGNQSPENESAQRQSPSHTALDWNARRYESDYSYVWKYGAGVLELLSPRPGERILDIGCGTGQLTAALAASGAMVIGIDNSPDMIAQARVNSPEIEFQLCDARDLQFKAPFDAVFSNAVLHWIQEPKPVIASVRRALKPGGRFVAEFGGRGNIHALVEAITASLSDAGYPAGPERNPWYFPGIPEYGELLESAGMTLTFAELFDRPTALAGGEAGMRNWLEMFSGPFLTAAPPEARAAILTLIEERLRPTLLENGTWYADYTRIRIVAVNEAPNPSPR